MAPVDKRLALLFGIPSKPLRSTDYNFSEPLPEPISAPPTHERDEHANRASVSALVRNAWSTEEGRRALCSAMTPQLQEVFNSSRILRQMPLEAVPGHYLGTEAVVSHEVVINSHEIRAAINPGSFIQRAMDQLRDEMLTHLMNTYYNQLGAVLEENPRDVAEIMGIPDGHLLFKSSHRQQSNSDWVFRHFDDQTYVVPAGLPWDEILWTTHLGAIEYFPAQVRTLSRPWDMSVGLTVLHGVRFSFPSPVYRIGEF